MDKGPREKTQKVEKQELWLLHSCIMLIDIQMKFRKDILNGFQVTQWTGFSDKVLREITKKVLMQELWFLHSALHLMFIVIRYEVLR